MISVECAHCGKTFAAKRKTAQYCTSRCRVEAKRQRDRVGAPPPRREGAQVYSLPAKPAEAAGSTGFYAATKRQLTEAGRADTYQGLAALFAAQVLDSGVQDTMSSMATMLREYKASMREALDGSTLVETPLEKLRRERELKTG